MGWNIQSFPGIKISRAASSWILPPFLIFLPLSLIRPTFGRNRYLAVAPWLLPRWPAPASRFLAAPRFACRSLRLCPLPRLLAGVFAPVFASPCPPGTFLESASFGAFRCRRLCPPVALVAAGPARVRSSLCPPKSFTMGGKLWSEEEERIFWEIIVPRSPRRLPPEQPADALNWSQCADLMREEMDAAGLAPRRDYTGLGLCKLYFHPTLCPSIFLDSLSFLSFIFLPILCLSSHVFFFAVSFPLLCAFALFYILRFSLHLAVFLYLVLTHCS